MTAPLRDTFRALTSEVTAFVGHGELQAALNERYPADGADSAHPPTVSGGRALVLYLLPQGAIEFSRA